MQLIANSSDFLHIRRGIAKGKTQFQGVRSMLDQGADYVQGSAGIGIADYGEGNKARRASLKSSAVMGRETRPLDAAGHPLPAKLTSTQDRILWQWCA